MITELEIKIRVRYSETDAMGYLHHANYVNYFEMGRIELLRAQGGSYREMEEQGIFIVVARLAIRYKSPARYDDLLRLKTVITKTTAVKIEYEYKVYRDDILVAEADSMLACINKDGIPQKLPDSFQMNK